MYSSGEVNRKLILNSILQKMAEIGEGKLKYKNIIGPEKIPHSEIFKKSGLFTLIKRYFKDLDHRP